MKRLDFSIKEGRLEYHIERDQRLTGEQLYNLLMALICGGLGCAAFLGFFAMMT